MVGSDRGYRYSDCLFWCYNSIVVIFLVLSGHRVDHRWALLSSNVGLILLSVAIIRVYWRQPENTLFRFARHWYPFFYFSYLHWESGMIRHLFHPHSFDALVKYWDLSLFGDYLHNILYQFQPIWFAECIHFTYFFYYILIFLTGLLLYRSDLRNYKRYIFDITILYLAHYTVFYVFPVVGPIDLHLARFPDGVIFIPLMKFLYRVGDSPGGAMPSSHVSVAVLAWVWLYRYSKKIAMMASVFTVSLIFSTVYLSYHYAIDTVAGFAVGVFFVVLMFFLRRRYGEYSFI